MTELQERFHALHTALTGFKLVPLEAADASAEPDASATVA